MTREDLLNDLIEWLDIECQPEITTADLSHDFADKLRSRLDEIRQIPLPSAEGAEEILKNNLNEHLWTFISTYRVAFKADVMLRDWIIAAMQEFVALTADKIAEERLREELIAYQEYATVFDNKFSPTEDLIDGYLKSRKP